MHGTLGTVALAACVWLVLGGSCAIACSLLWRMQTHWTATWHPRLRARIYAILAVTPALVPTAALLLCLAPGLAGQITGRGDHCSVHVDHPHLCLFHASPPLSAPLTFALLLLSTGIAISAARAIRWTLEGRRIRSRLAEDTSGRLSTDVRIVCSTDFFALTAGIVHPKIWISSALDGALTPEERDVVIAHERAHVARRDPARWLLTSFFSALHLPATRKAILGALRLASEQDCDARAATLVHDRLRVAETLLRVEGLMKKGSSAPTFGAGAGAMGLGGSTVPDRVKLLLGEGTKDPVDLSISTLAIIGAASCVLAAKPLHHAVEHVLEAIARLA